MTPFASALVAPILHSGGEDPVLAGVELGELRRGLLALLPPWREKIYRALDASGGPTLGPNNSVPAAVTELVRLEALIEYIDALVATSR